MSNLLCFPAPQLRSCDNKTLFGGATIQAYAQPQVNLRSLQFEGVEILARWHHPDRGLLLPAQVLPTLGGVQAFNELSCALIEQSLAFRNAPQGAGHTWRFAFNVALAQLEDIHFVDFLRRLPQPRPGLAADLVLEVTEQRLANQHHTDRALTHLAELRDCGWLISLDDFGTGESTYARLCDLPVDELKIESRFTRQLGEGQRREDVIVRHLIELAAELGLRCVAEGIEFADQFLLLERLGCDQGQGYLFSPPIPIEALDAWCQAWQIRAAQARAIRQACDLSE